MPAQETSSSPIERITWQPILFAERLRRSELLPLQASWPLQAVNIAVHRNQPFELIGAVLPPFLAYAGLKAELHYGDYDDSLSFAGAGAVDVHIVSLDFDRYANQFNVDGLLGWLVRRLQTLRSMSAAPILISNWCSDDGRAAEFNARIQTSTDGIPALYVCDLASIAAGLGDDAFDDRSAEIKASRWSDQLALQGVRSFGLQWIPAITLPPLRAIAVDLDGTLYDGVLGEDGAKGIRLTDAHAAIQRQLVALREAGIFIAVVSRNEREDVDQMFDLRSDFPLQRPHVSSLVVNWDSKAENIAAVAKDLRIGTDTFLFVDDNPGELATVESALPVRILHAADPNVTLAGLKFYPGLFRFARSATDAIRADDLAASQEREQQLLEAADPQQYLRSLDIELTFSRNNPAHLARMAELSNKTNQFNTALDRKSETEVVSRVDAGSLDGITISLKDKLSDSGIVGVVFAQSDKEVLRVEEICISCRALGRSLEAAMILQAIDLLADSQTETVAFSYARGPRNDPALRWLTANIGELTGESGEVVVPWNGEKLQETLMSTPATLSIEGTQ